MLVPKGTLLIIPHHCKHLQACTNTYNYAPAKCLGRKALTPASQFPDDCASCLEVQLCTFQLPCGNLGTGTGYAVSSEGTVPAHSYGLPHPTQEFQDQPGEKSILAFNPYSKDFFNI